MLKITSGKLKGRKLLTARGIVARPTLEKTRAAIFDTLQSRFCLKHYVVYDLFAGSGALGLEAFSRGASKARFFESDRRTFVLLLKNIKNLSLENWCEVLFEDAIKWLKRQTWDITPKLFLLDPPYDTTLAQQAIDILSRQKKFLLNSLIVLETEKEHEVRLPNDFFVFRRKQFGKTRLDFIEVQTESTP